MQIKDKVFVVTGAGSGMGRELAKQLAEKGAKVALSDINEDSLKETQEIIGADKSSVHVLNVADKAAVEKLPQEVISAHGQVDAIINNAGIIHPFIPVKDLGYDIIERILNVNFYGTVYMTKAFLPHLLERPQAHIANVSSMGGFLSFPGQTLYSASKAAVKVFTEGLYGELKNTNVGVTVIFPGAIATNIQKNSGLEVPEGAEAASAMQMTPADKAASIMLEAIEQNKFSVMVGQDAEQLDALYRANPENAVNMIVEQMSKMGH